MVEGLAPYVAFEGLDGSGKSTQCALAEEYLKSKGLSFLSVREPGTTLLGTALRSLLLDKNITALTPLEEVLIFSAARSSTIREVVLPARQGGKIVLSDRSWISTLAYQGGGGGVSRYHIEQLSSLVLENCPITHALLIDVPADVGLSRVGRGQDKIESRGVEYFERVRGSFRAYHCWNPLTSTLIDGTLPMEEVQRLVRNTLDNIIEKYQEGIKD